MRALAVLAVLLFHLELHGFAGGYLGVDLFFVISGFIITRNLCGDLHGGRFSLRDFYVRRFRRLFPALLVTVLLTLLFSLWLLPPQVLRDSAESALYALFSLANIHFWLQSGYFDAAAHTKPLLHTWSLSVEEQFYLFWPLLLAWLAARRGRPWLLGLLLVSSMGASLALLLRAPDAVFYLLPFRLHQLMAGALVAVLVLRLEGRAGSIAALAGVLAFLALVTLFGPERSPVVGALGVTFAGSLLLLGRESLLAHRILGAAPLQWLGRRSYAIYLVHWPLIVLYQFATDFNLHAAEQAGLLVASSLLAIALHEVVEKPFRKRGEDTTGLQRRAVPLTLATMGLTVLFAVFVVRSDGFPGTMDEDLRRLVENVDVQINERKRLIRFGQCNLHKQHDFADYDRAVCAGGDDAPRVLVVGDSLAADIYMMLSLTYPQWNIRQATAGACTALVNLTEAPSQYPACLALNEFRFGELLDEDFDLVVLASVWKPQRLAPLKETVNHLQSRGHRVLLIGPRVAFRGSVRILAATNPSVDAVTYSLQDKVRHNHALHEQFVAELPDATVVDMRKVQCGTDCPVIVDNALLYYDNMHWTREGALYFGRRFASQVDMEELVHREQAPVSPRGATATGLAR